MDTKDDNNARAEARAQRLVVGASLVIAGLGIAAVILFLVLSIGS
jgi:hypothetical protein